MPFYYIDRTSYRSCLATYREALRLNRATYYYADASYKRDLDDSRLRLIGHYLALRALAQQTRAG